MGIRTDDSFKLELMERLLEIPYAKKASSKQITIRCVFCGDSRKHHDSTHLSIKIDINSDEPILFNCLLCHVGGVLSSSLLKECNIWDLALYSKVTSYNNETIKKTNKKLGIVNNNIKLNIPVYKNENILIKHKKTYIENRLGVSLTYDDLYKMKVVFNLNDMLRINKIKSTCKDDKLKLLHNDYVGFLSCKNEFVICRNTIKNSNKRYDKYNVFYSLENTRQFYSIPNEIDLVSSETIEINIAEGIFDIYGVYYHIHNANKINKIFVAVCGSGFVNVIKYFINLGLFGYNIILNIYSDRDKGVNYYKSIKNNLSVWFKQINLYYNEINHDFGVTKDKIKIIGGLL